MNGKPEITTEEFDKLLRQFVSEMQIDALLRVDGIYEILSEEFNNAILDRWENWEEVQA